MAHCEQCVLSSEVENYDSLQSLMTCDHKDHCVTLVNEKRSVSFESKAVKCLFPTLAALRLWRWHSLLWVAGPLKS